MNDIGLPITWEFLPEFAWKFLRISAHIKYGVFMSEVKPGQTVIEAVSNLPYQIRASVLPYIGNQQVSRYRVILPGDVIELI